MSLFASIRQWLSGTPPKRVDDKLTRLGERLQKIEDDMRLDRLHQNHEEESR